MKISFESQFPKSVFYNFNINKNGLYPDKLIINHRWFVLATCFSLRGFQLWRLSFATRNNNVRIWNTLGVSAPVSGDNSLSKMQLSDWSGGWWRMTTGYHETLGLVIEIVQKLHLAAEMLLWFSTNNKCYWISPDGADCNFLRNSLDIRWL